MVNVLMKQLYLIRGPPEILVHDQGGEFWSDIMTQLADLLEKTTNKDHESPAKCKWRGGKSACFSPLHVWKVSKEKSERLV